MSHFLAVVFAEDPNDFDALLARYNECDKKYYQFAPIDGGAEEVNRRFDRFIKDNPSWNDICGDCVFDEYLKSHGIVCENGVYGCYHNPDGRYDYYTLDGRLGVYESKHRGYWSDRKKDFIWTNNAFDTRLNMRCPLMRLFDKIHTAFSSAVYWIRAVRHFDYSNEKLNKNWPAFMYDRYGSMLGYVRENLMEAPPAYITPDGVWHSPGNIGYFATDDFTKESVKAYYKEWKQFLRTAPDDLFVSFCDMHI